MNNQIVFIAIFSISFLQSHARVLDKWSNKFAFPPHLIGTNSSVSSELDFYKDKYHPVDLGVDNLDDDAPMHIRKALADATVSDDPSVNQYTSGTGLPRLRRAIAEMYSPLIGHQLNPDDNVLVTIGAAEAVYSTIVGHTFEGDEWVLIEPAYNIYLPIIRQARGVAKLTSLKLKISHNGTAINGDDWQFDKDEFESLLSERTKGIILNNPVNPIGKVLSFEELLFIGSMARKYDLLIVSDEAHEWVTYKRHIRIASIPGLYERTITIGSASKTFSLGGWRIGWAFGPKHILNHAKTVHSRAVSSASVPQQVAIAFAFEEEIRNFGKPNSYFDEHKRHVQQQRDLLTEAFVDAGMKPVFVDGGYCVFVDWSPLRKGNSKLRTSLDFTIWLIEKVGVLGFPGISYYADEHRHLGEDYARFCFHKKMKTLEEAVRRLKKLKHY